MGRSAPLIVPWKEQEHEIYPIYRDPAAGLNRSRRGNRFANRTKKTERETS